MQGHQRAGESDSCGRANPWILVINTYKDKIPALPTARPVGLDFTTDSQILGVNPLGWALCRQGRRTTALGLVTETASFGRSNGQQTVSIPIRFTVKVQMDANAS